MIYSINHDISFINKFRNLKTLKLWIPDISPVTVSSCIKYPNIYSRLQCLHVHNAIIDIIFFNSIKYCKSLNYLALIRCYTNFDNTINLWNYYTIIQNDISHIEQIELDLSSYFPNEIDEIPLTLVRILMH